MISNSITDEGAHYLLDSSLRSSPQIEIFYVRLFNTDSISKKSIIGNLAGEPAVADYIPQPLPASSVGFPTLGLTIPINESGVVSASTNNTLILDASGSVIQDFYKYSTLKITGGVGAGQTRNITSYDNLLKTATIDRDWTIAPFAGDIYEIVSEQLLTSAEVVFTSTTMAWGPVNTVVLADTPTGITGKMIAYFKLPTPTIVNVGDSLKFKADIKIS